MRLSTSRLVVDVASPGETYRGARFDWTSFITQVTLDGKHRFCAAENEGGTGGVGFCNEFGISTALGYEAAAVGGRFIKPGVGLLTKANSEPYFFGREYPICPFPMHVEQAPHRVRFVVDPLPCNGYALRLTKELTVSENTMRIAYCLENVGSMRVLLDEYCHNFIAIDGRAAARGMRLNLPFRPQTFPTLSMLATKENAIHWTSSPTVPSYCRVDGATGTEPAWWELVDAESGLGVRESGDFGWSRFALFCTQHVISPEMFVRIDVAPGHSQRWAREYEFFAVSSRMMPAARQLGEAHITVAPNLHELKPARPARHLDAPRK